MEKDFGPLRPSASVESLPNPVSAAIVTRECGQVTSNELETETSQLEVRFVEGGLRCRLPPVATSLGRGELPL